MVLIIPLSETFDVGQPVNTLKMITHTLTGYPMYCSRVKIGMNRDRSWQTQPYTIWSFRHPCGAFGFFFLHWILISEDEILIKIMKQTMYGYLSKAYAMLQENEKGTLKSFRLLAETFAIIFSNILSWSTVYAGWWRKSWSTLSTVHVCIAENC